MRTKSLVAAASVVCGLALSPTVAAADAAGQTTWAGWDAPAPVGVGTPTHVAASGGTTAVLGGDLRDDTVPIAVQGPTGSRVGRVPAGGSGSGLRLALAGPDRLLVADGCRIRRSTDQGLTWADVALAACSSGPAPSLLALDANVAYASTATRTWRTLDGGASWAVVNGGEAGPQLLLDADTGLRIVNPGAGVFALQRTVNAGGTWQGLKVPDTQVAPPKPEDTAPPATVDSLPAMAGLARRSDGAVVVGAGSTLLVSTDRGATFVRHEVPVPDDLPGAPSAIVDAVVCDAAGSCVVGVHASNDPARRSALRFEGDAFVGRVGALPTSEAQSVGPNAIVGMVGSSDAVSAVRTDDAGATPYRALASAADRPGSIGVHGLLAIPSVGRLYVSTDHGANWKDLPDLAAPKLVRVASAKAGLVGLADDGTVWLLKDGAWTRQADLSSIKPAALAVASGVPIVVGARGVSRLADLAKPTPISATLLQGRGFSHVVAQGSTIVAWQGRTAVRSTDAGRRWTRAKLPAGASDVQLATPKVAYALVKATLYRSSNGGSSFKRAVTVPNLKSGGPSGVDASANGSIEFSSATSGVLLSGLGTYVTRNGGKSVEALPTPGALKPAVASVFGNGVVVQDPVVGAVFRNGGLLKQRAPGLTVRVSGARKAAKRGAKRRLKARTVTIVGVLKGADNGQPVAVMAVGRGGRLGSLKKVVVPNADGSFRLRIKLSRSESGVQAWFRGSVGTTRTARATASKVLAVR